MATKIEDALRVVYSCAKDYKNNLLGKSLLFVFTDKHKKVHCLEVAFEARHFQHLTGLKTEKSGILSVDFFERCLDQRLSLEDVEFSKDGTTPRKLAVLPKIMKNNLSAKMIGDYNNSHPKLVTECIAGSVVACVGFVRDRTENKYVPNTVLEGDIRNRVFRTDRIILTYRKNRCDNEYSEIVYKAKNVDWSKIKLPQEYDYLVLPDANQNKESFAAIEYDHTKNIDLKSSIIDTEKEIAICSAIETYRDIEWDNDKIIGKLIQRFGISEDTAIKYVSLHE